MADLQHEPDKTIRVLNQWLMHHPLDVGFLQYRGYELWLLGRTEEALSDFVRINDVSPFGANPMSLKSQFEMLVELGRIEEARTIVPRIVGRWRGQAEMGLWLLTSDWAKVESLSVRQKNDPASDDRQRRRAESRLAEVCAVRGELDSAWHVYSQHAVEAGEQGACLALSQLLVVTHRSADPALLEACPPTTPFGQLMHGVLAAAMDDLDSAHACLQAMRELSAPERRRFATDMKFLEACIASRTGDWMQVIGLLETATRSGQIPDSVGRLPIRWLVAEAFANLGNHEKAVEYFELVLAPTSFWILRGIYSSFAHHRLILLYSRMGRVEDARRHWEAFVKTFTHPDVELVPMLEEARQALEDAQAREAF
jgi:tetratricopeptide (TPR) repeat protein